MMSRILTKLMLLVFCFCFSSSLNSEYLLNTLENDIFVSESLLSASLLAPISENCTRALQNFNRKIIAVSNCTVDNARPIRVCMNCEREINDISKAYEALKNESSDCKQFYFESDQIRIVDLVYSAWQNIVKKCNCLDCYYNANETAQFFNLSKEFDACFLKANSSSANSTCEMCQDLFAELNKLYNQFVQRISSYDVVGVCMDIVDKMNITRQNWSSLNCVFFDFNIGYPNIITAVLIGAMPVLFYMLARNISIIEDVKLVRPKRKSFSAFSSE